MGLGFTVPCRVTLGEMRGPGRVQGSQGQDSGLSLFDGIESQGLGGSVTAQTP